MKHLFGFLFFACVCSLFAAAVTTPAVELVGKEETAPVVNLATMPTHRQHLAWWKTRLAEKEEQAKKQHDTVFIGDSITHNWDNIAPDLQKQYFGEVLNLGFSGDKTQDVIWRINRIDWKVVSPKRIMLMIGTNNTGHCKSGTVPENTVEGIRVIVNTLREACPQAKITLLAIFPRGDNDEDPKRQINDKINLLLPALADEKTVFYRDISPFYMMPDGKTLNRSLLPDRLHPNKEGHRLWAAAVSRDFMRDYQ